MISQAGLISIDEKYGVHDKFWNRVMFPIMDVNSRVIGFGGRVWVNAKPKYLNSPETIIFDKSRNLYGLNRARKSRKPYFLLCEGYMDVISLHQAGFTNAVASLGTALTPGHAALIKRYVNEVYLTYDSDEAGTKAALRADRFCVKLGLRQKSFGWNRIKIQMNLLKISVQKPLKNGSRRQGMDLCSVLKFWNGIMI